MRKIYLSFFIIILSCFQILAQDYVWAKNISTGVTCNSIAVDDTGNVYVTGSFWGIADFVPGPGEKELVSNSNSEDFFVAKYSSIGTLIWVFSLGDMDSQVGKDIKVDAAGNIYVTGTLRVGGDFDPGPGVCQLNADSWVEDVFIAKYSNAGTFIWAKRIGGNSWDMVNSLDLDASGNIYITGMFTSATVDFDPDAGTQNINSNGGADVFFAKYNSSGNYLLAKGFGGTGDDEGRGIAFDPAGNIYVTGTFSGTADFDPDAGTLNIASKGNKDIFIAKYNSSGAFVWANSFGKSYDDYGRDIAVDASGNVYAVGSFQSTVDFDPGAGTVNFASKGSEDIYIAKYNSSGNYLWAYGFGNSYYDYAMKCNFDVSGNLLVTGSISGAIDFDPGPDSTKFANSQGSFFGKYTPAGNLIWVKALNTGGVYANNITTGKNNETYISGALSGTGDLDPDKGVANLTSGNNGDMFFAKYIFNKVKITSYPVGDTLCKDYYLSVKVRTSGTVPVKYQWYKGASAIPGATDSVLTFNGVTMTDSGYYHCYVSNCCTDTTGGNFHVSVKEAIAKADKDTLICYGSSAVLTAKSGNTDDSFSWNNSVTGKTNKVNPTAKTDYIVTVTTTLGCQAEDTVTVNVKPQYIPEICMVRYDGTEDRNMIVWQKPVSTNIKAYKVFIDGGSGNYTLLDSIPYSQMSSVIDTKSNPNTNSVSYVISAIDSCGNESVKSPFHRTLHIVPVKRTDNMAEISWLAENDYKDQSGVFSPSQYFIYRGKSKNTLTLLTQKAGNIKSFTDDTYDGGTTYYQVGFDRSCNPTGIMKAESGPYTQSLSNIAEYKVGAFENNNLHNASAYPNPFINSFTISFRLEKSDDVRIEVYNALGSLISSGIYGSRPAGLNEILIDQPLSPGVYAIKIAAGENLQMITCIKE